MRIYIESTIPSYVVARPARDLLQAVRQQRTKDWWDFHRGRHDLFTSQIVLDEIAAGESRMAQLRLKLLASMTVLNLSNDAETFATKVLHSGLLPAKADGDAAHIALATVHKMEILLTWNCRHSSRNSGASRTSNLPRVGMTSIDFSRRPANARNIPIYHWLVKSPDAARLSYAPL